jgi:predicted RNA binding protein YcfA (HicA-like mRNA interferase family)
LAEKTVRENVIIVGGNMPQKVRQLKASLRKAGVYQVSQEGSHTKWKHSLLPSAIVVLSGNDGDDARPYQEKDVKNMLADVKRAREKKT